MTTYHNPALHEEPRNQSMKSVPPLPRESLLNWLENSGRFQATQVDESDAYKMAEDLDSFLEPEIYSPDNEEEEID